MRGIKLLTLKREFEQMKMQEGESVKDYSTNVINLVNQIRLFGGDFKDQRVVEKMMINLSEKFESKLSVIEKTCNLIKLTVADLISKLQAQEPKTSIKSDSKGKQVATISKEAGQSFGLKSKEQQSSKESNKKEKLFVCSLCNRSGHLESKCLKNLQCRVCKKT